MENFEDQINNAIRNKVIKEIGLTQLTRIEHSQKGVVPQSIINDLWKSVNWLEVIEELRPKLQTRICNTIAGAVETEIKTDVKKLLAVDGVRQKLRMEVYPKLMKVLEGEE